LLVHIGDPSSNQATTLESQMIHMIQELFGQTLRSSPPQNVYLLPQCPNLCLERCPRPQ
jgi:hypothetical protein